MMLVSMETARDVATQLMETAPSVSYNFLHRAGILMGDSAISSNINYDDYLGDWKSIVKKLKESHPIVAGLSDILLLALHKTFKNPAGPTEALKQVEERACANNVAVNFYNFVNVGVPRDVFDDPILGRKYVRVIEGPANGRRSLPSCKSRLEFHGFSMASRSLLTKPLSRRKIQGKGTTKGNVKDDANYDDGTQIEQKWLKGKPRKESRVRVTRRTIDVSMAGNAPDVHLREFCLETAKTGVAKLVKDFNETRAASLKTPISRTAFDHNMDKNRYKDVVCGDEGRVVLTWPPGHPNDYIHANWVPVNGEKRYICTQGPTTKTVEDFWRLVWQEKSKGIVMLCGVMEMGKKKCEQYWPLKQGEQMISGLLTIRNMKVHEYEKMLISSALELSWQGETHRVEHIIWNGWPDRGVPDNYLACLRLIRKMAPLAPVIVHCSAGIGRTGTIVGLDMCQVNLHNGEPINMADIVRELRVHRHGSVQTDVQYIYMHRVLFSLAENKKAIREPEGASFLAEFQAFIKMKESLGMDDDDFNTLAYDDPDPFATGERQAGLFEDGEDIENIGNVTTGRGVKRPADVIDLNGSDNDVDMSVIDWHMRIDTHPLEELRKRRQDVMDEEAIKRLKRRMNDVKRRRTMPTDYDGEPAVETTTLKKKREELLSVPPIDGTPWLGVSSADRMERLYVRLRPLELPKGVENLAEEASVSTQNSFLAVSQPKKRSQMNAVPMHVLMSKANALLEEQQKERDREIDALLSEEYAPRGAVDSALWVDKYSPKCYAELLSDDGINRMLLTWVKMWDECSFKRKPPSIEHLLELEQKNLELDATMKPDRPRLRAAILYGQPGMGKTTLASIIARQAGYNPIDVNASGDRKVDYLKGLIEGVVRSVGSVNSMQQNNAKPNCLIIDEIDGAHVDTIKYLVSVISDKGRHAIRRPIICICNNLFATALRTLRPHAFLLELPATHPNRLHERLRTICDQEKLWLERAALQRVVEGCFGDIRSCLNTLQMLKSKQSADPNERITVSVVNEAINRQGIGRESMFDQWASVFSLTKHLDGKGIVKNEKERCRQLATMVSTCDELDKFHSGLYHNYLGKNVSLSAVKKAIVAFETLDLIETRIHKTQNYEMMRYMSTVTISVHLAVASHTRKKLEFPAAEQMIRDRMRQSIEVVSAIRSRPEVFKYSQASMVLDVLPQAIVIVQPPLKPMNESLYKAQELEAIKTSVDVHITLSSTFQLVHTQTGTNYVFQPPWNEIASFPFGPDYFRPNMVNSVRQMIAHRIELARIGLTEAEVAALNKKKQTGGGQPKSRAMSMLPEKTKLALNGKRFAIFYKFNQGSSNAIRRIIRMNGLF